MIERGKFILYKLENDKLIKQAEAIGKFVNIELNDRKGKFIVYKLENGKLVKEYEKIGKFINGIFKKGKFILYDKNQRIEQIGKFVNGILNDKKGKIFL